MSHRLKESGLGFKQTLTIKPAHKYTRDSEHSHEGIATTHTHTAMEERNRVQLCCHLLGIFVPVFSLKVTYVRKYF